MKLLSSAFNHNDMIPSRFTCDKENINPPLLIQEVPVDTKSLALIMDDPDAVSGVFVHWIVYNMDPSIRKIPENSIPTGIEGITSAGKPGYVGPCPPSGKHRYFFKLYALSGVLPSKPVTKEELEKEMKGKIVDSIELIGLYSRT